MSTEQLGNVITSTEMLQKIGLLAMSNDFLSAQVAAFNQYISTYHKNVLDEIGKIEAEIAASTPLDPLVIVARIKAKLG